MHYIRVERRDAEKAKRKLIGSRLLDSRRSVEHSDSYVYFPTHNISTKTIKKLIGRSAALVDRAPAQGKHQTQIGFKDRMRAALSKKEYEAAPKGYDIVGNIAIVDFPDSLKKNEKTIAQIIMDIHPHITTVLAKAGAVSGKYRTRKFRHVLGKKSFVTTYKESGCVFEFDVRKTFFSNRLAFERARIAGLVKDKENVVVMFSGVGPFVILIAKKHPRANVVGMELNKSAHASALRNMALNRTANATAELGDVRKLARKYRNFADRIIMPLPKESLSFLDEVKQIAKKRAVVHLYAFGKSASAYDDAIAVIRKHAEAKGYRVRVVSKRVVRPYSAEDVEVVIDYMLEK